MVGERAGIICDRDEVGIGRVFDRLRAEPRDECREETIAVLKICGGQLDAFDLAGKLLTEAAREGCLAGTFFTGNS